MKTENADAAKPTPSDAEKNKLKGPVKQVMQTWYSAHRNPADGSTVQGKIEVDSTYDSKNSITSYNESGRKTEEKLYGSYNSETKHYDALGQNFYTDTYNMDGTLKESRTIKYDENQNMIEYVTVQADGTTSYRVVYTYNERGKEIEKITYHGADEKVFSRTISDYNEKGDALSIIEYNGDGSIKHQSLSKYDENGKRIEWRSEYTDPAMAKYNMFQTYGFNKYGDCIEMNYFKADGLLDKHYTFSYQYDSEGKKIVPEREHYDPDALKPGETEAYEYDDHDNWTKRISYFKKSPVNITIREIIYFGDPERILVHPVTISNENDIKDTRFMEEAMATRKVKWLVESPNASTENFSALRYYALLYHEHPSLIVYSGPCIEAMMLLERLKDELEAQEIHSHSAVWNGHEKRVLKYTLSFPTYPGYLLQAIGISSQEKDSFILPRELDDTDEDYVFISPIHLLLPSEASGRRNEDFEYFIIDNIDFCTLEKQPDKPVINIIETTSSGFVMKEHGVDDKFEIKDLDVNYGYGFKKFHTDLMNRFNTSTKGLVLFHGEPGTGKTYYIRHLLRKMAAGKKVVIYMPPNMVDHLVEPGFMTFLTNNVQEWSEDGFFCVLLIEDAEPLLAKRQQGVRIQGITNLLNMTDGLLNDLLNLQIICTFNVDLRKIDSALLRPGRLIARKEFKALGELDANLLAQRLGVKHHFTGPATLGEIYALRENENTLVHDVDPEDDASTNIDDLL